MPGLPDEGLRSRGSPGCWGPTRGAGLAHLWHLTPPPPGWLHHQAGDLHPGAPEDHRGGGRWHRLCAGSGGRAGPHGCRGHGRPVAVPCSLRLCAAALRHDLHVLPIQEPEAGTLLTLPGAPRVPQLCRLTTELTLLMAPGPESQDAAPYPLPRSAREVAFSRVHPRAATVTSGDPLPQRELQVPFSPDQRTEAGPSGCGEGGILCLVWGHWLLTVRSLSASPVGLGPWEGGPPPMPVLRQRGWFGVNWAERGWPPQGAPRPLDTTLHGGQGIAGWGQPQAKSPRCTCRWVAYRHPSHPPAPLRKAKRARSCPAGPVSALPVRPLLPEPLLGFPTTPPTERPQAHLFTITSPWQKQGVVGSLTAVSQMPRTAAAM